MKSALLRGSALFPAALAMVGASSAVFAQAVNMGGRGNSIVPDGRTATTLTVQGTVTSIRTSTFAGGNAYNSFSTFSEASGNTVNLIVPNSANNLVNIVRNGAVNIQGTLNSYQNGRIGGNVVFADSYGFVVGKSGVINVGGLTVVTPSGATLDQIVDANGNVNTALAAQMIAGSVPLSADGSVVIGGRINARNFVRITAQDVRVAGSMAEAKRVAMHRAQFESTVNATGLVEGGSIVVRNGSISIVAANNATIGGRLSAGGRSRHAGTIAVTANHDLSIQSSAQLVASATNASRRSRRNRASATASAPSITLDAGATATISGTLSVSASDLSLPGEIGIRAVDISVTATAQLIAQGTGTQNAGHISIKASDDTDVAAGASVLANAIGSGNGGFVEISATNTDNIATGITINLGAVSGNAGTLLFDPDALVIGGVNQGSQGDSPVVGGTSTLGSIYTDGGNVELDAISSIEIAGVIDTREYAGVSGGSYVTGLLAASGIGSEGNSGSITLKAPSITIDSGGALYADVNNVSGTTFTAGAVTLSTVCPGCGPLGVDNPENGTITINGTVTGASLAANANGGSVTVAGTVDVRPEGTFAASEYATTGPILLSGGSITVASGGILYADGYNSTDVYSSVELNASSTVTIDGTIDTRAYAGTAVAEALTTAGKASTTDSGSILLNAPSISVASTGALYADVNNVGGTTYKGGAVTLDATASDYEAILEASATASITIEGTITGASIAVNANATAEAVFALNSNNATPGNLSTVLTMSTLLDLSPLSLSPGYVQADGTSSVTIDGTANLDATGNITLNSHTVGNASDPALGLSPGGAFFAAGTVVGILDQTTTTEIADGAHISAGSLDVAATNDATENIGSTVVTGFAGQTGAPFVVTVAYGEASINSTAEINSGAVISVSGTSSSVDVLARNDNSFTADAKSYARTGGVAAAAIAIGDFNSSAIAHVGADIGSSSAQVGSAAVVANSETSKDQVSATAIDGQGLFGDIFTTAGLVGNVGSQAANASVTPPTAGIISTIIGNKYGSNLSGALPQFAGAVSVSIGTQTSDADVAADLDANGNRIVPTAPTIDASGNVAIVSDTTDSAAASLAASTVNSTANSTSISAGVDVTLITHNSSAVIGPDVTIDAGDIGVQATSSVPSPIENINWDSFSSVLDGLLANTSIVTTDADAAAASSGVGISGSLNYLSLTQNTTAWVATGANLTTTDPDSSWTTPDLSGLDSTSGIAAITTTFDKSLSVLAADTVETINISGNFAPLGGVNASGGTAVGGSLGLLYDTNNTIAGIAQSTSITSAGTLDVDAETTDDAINIAPTNGKGAGINLTGLASVFVLDDTTSASISNDANVSANSVDVDAVQALRIYTVTGDVTQSGASAVGISIAYAGLTTTTEAFIGDNATVVGTGIDPDEDDTSALGSVTTNDLDIDAKTTGNDVVGALAVQVATGSSPSPPPPLPSGSKAAALLGITESTSGSSVSLAISGSAAYTDTDLTTEAYLDDAKVKGNQTAPSLTVNASNNTLVVSASGAAALAFGNSTKALTAAVAAAAALDFNSDSTLAYIEGSNVSQFGSVDVDAQSTGLVAVVGLGIAVSQQSSEQPAGGFAGSFSAAHVADQVAAYIDDSTVSNTSSSGNAVVLADQQTEIGIGGGSFFFGGNGGGGLALTYTDIVDPSAGPATDAHISNSSVTNFNDIDVVAESPQAIYSAAAEATSSSVGIGGAVVITTDDATTSATISNSGTTPLSITATDDVFVLAATDPNDLPSSASPAAFDSSDSGASAAAADYGDPTSDSSSSNAADGALLSSGSAAILSIAGNIIVGGSNGVGLSLIDNTIGEAHIAEISGVTVTAPDALTVSALDSTAILAIGVGAGDSSQASIQAADVTNSITSSATAFIGPETGATVPTAATDAIVGEATMEAEDSSAISVYALVVAIGNGSADGYSIATSTIDTQTSTGINAATVDATGDPSDTNATGDVIVAANSSAQIYTYAVGVADSNSVGVAGSAATSLEESDVDASIGGSSIVSATNNVGVLASNDNVVNAVAGAGAISYPPGAAGAGVSVTVDKITGSTEATIDASTVDAQALGTGSLLIVNGVLDPTSTATESAPTDPDSAEDPASIPDLGTDVRSDHGLALVASSVQTADVVAVTLGVTKGASLTLNTVTNIMGGTTEAEVSGSSLDTNLLAANAAPTIDVGAISVSYANDLVANIAGSSGNFAASAGSAADSFDRTTTASVSGTSIGSATAAAGTVTIGATGYEGSAGEVLGLALSGGNSVAGSIFVNLFSADTEASLVGGTIDAGSLSVNSTSTNGYFAAAGTVAGGTAVGVGATVLVGIFSDTTLATVGDSTDTTATTLNLAGQLTVGATNTADVDSYVLGASVGGDSGAAAQITYTELDSTTGAALDYASVVLTPPTGDTGDVNVTSQDNATIDPITGGFAGGGSAGIGASANVVILQSTNQSQISDSDVTTPGAVMVSATSDRDINPYTATGALAGEFSLAASVGVILVGDAASSDELGLLNMGGDGTLASADATAGQGSTLVNALNGGVDGISAAIDGGTITAGSVAIDATGDVETMNLDGSVSLSLGGSIGAAVGYTEVDQSIGASAVGGTIQTGSLSIDATAGDDGTGHAAQTAALAGAGGLYVGVGAAVALSTDNNDVTAALSATVDDGTGTATVDGASENVVYAANSVSLSATDTSTVRADAIGFALGGAAVGVSVATATRDSDVTAEVATVTTTTSTPTNALGFMPTVVTTIADDDLSTTPAGTVISNGANGTPVTAVTTVAFVASGTVSLDASDSGQTYSYALAGAGGVFAGDGTAATATDTTTVLASVVGESTIIAQGATGFTYGLTVMASDTPDLKAAAVGVALGAVGIGESYTDASVDSSITANVDGAAVLAGTVGLDIAAASDIDGTPATSFPYTSSVAPDLTGSFTAGGTTAAADSVAGSGGDLLAGNATEAYASDDATVIAQAGTVTTTDGITTITDLYLPAGAVSITATNATDQVADGTGVAVSGGLAVGVVLVSATASPMTNAIANVTTPLTTTSSGAEMSAVTSVSVNASGTDNDSAVAMAGSGGFYAGDGASASTSDTSNVNATIGADSFIEAASIQVAASHTDNFYEMADSLNAGLVGASAALSSHDASSNVGVTVGDNATLYATASGLAPCLSAGCTPALDITAANNFNDSSSGTEAGAGGGINGAGATSTITIDNNGEGAAITIGAGAILSSGFDPVNDPGSLAVIASTDVSITDTDNLTTGGLIEGAGVSAEVEGQLNNNVTIGAGAALTTYGVLDIGTYTTGNVTADAYVSTYGVAGVGDANAGIDLISNQTVDVDASASPTMPTLINAFSNVNITAGDYIDGGFVTGLVGDTNAEAYVRGLIAVPVANAHTSIASNATADLAEAGSGGSQTDIGSGANVTINADPGTPLLASDGTGHGYELGFIPVTDGNDDTSAPLSSLVTIGAAVVAGEYHDQEVTINSDLSVTVAPGGAPLSYAETQDFDILTFLTDDFSGSGSFGSLVSTSDVPTVSLGALYASGGLVRIDATTIQGNGSLTAYGAATINVTDNYPIYVILAGGALIPDLPGGSVVFTGSAGLSNAQAAGISVNQNNSTATPSITVTLSYNGSVGNSTAGPGLFITGPLTNVGGLIALYNDYGSIGAGGTVVNANGNTVPANITADTSIVYEPNGAYVFQADDASGNYIAGGSAYAEWASDIVYPGGNPSTSLANAPNADTAIEYLANAIYVRGSYYGYLVYATGNGSDSSTGPSNYSTSAAPVANYTQDELNEALYGNTSLSPNDHGGHNAIVLEGVCGGSIGARCESFSGYQPFGNNNNFPNYDVEQLTYSYSATGNANPANNESTGGSAASKQVYGSYVAITAATIDVNGSITIGKSTSYAADVSANLGTVLTDLQQIYQDNEYGTGNYDAAYANYQTALIAAGYTTANGYTAAQLQTLALAQYGLSVDITPFLSESAASASLGVTTTYSPQSGQVTFGTISTFSAGASVKLDGDIISTNILGNIHVNSGYGAVSITNESNIALDFGDINTGSVGGATAGTSTITITNRLIDQVNAQNDFADLYQGDTTTYIYNPASGLKQYLSDNGASPINSSGDLVGDATLVTTLSCAGTSCSTNYQTVIGAEFEFVQEATLSRSVVNGPGNNAQQNSDWVFTSGTESGTVNNPWYYVPADAISGLSADAPSSTQSATPVGEVIISSNVKNGVNQDPAFQETITGDTDSGGYGNETQQSYLPGQDINGTTVQDYNFIYPTSAFLRLTTTVKADNPFSVSFGGNATGSLNITSDGNVNFAGTVNNPTGETYISADGYSAVTQTPTASLTSNSLNVFGQVGIGTPKTPLNVTLSAGLGTTPVGSLVAKAEEGNVDINLNSGANGFAVGTTYGGTVVVNAAGSLQSDGSDGLDVGLSAIGNNITISSANGSIGSASSPLSLVSPEDPFVSTGHYGNVTANISASGDIGLSVPYGSLLVGQITSTGNGDISINVPNGNIYAAASQTPASSLSTTQVADIVSALNLEGGTGGNADATAGAAAITEFQTLVNSDLASYANFLATGTVSTTGSVTLDSTDSALYATLANSAAIQTARANQTQASVAATQFTSPTTAQIQTDATSLDQANGLFTLTITSANVAGYQTQTAAALGITIAGFLPQAQTAHPLATSVQLQAYATTLYNTAVANITNAQIEAWADAKYQTYATTFTEAYGSGWESTVGSATPPTSFTVAASPNAAALTTTLTSGASWTPAQLVDAIDVSALQPASGNVGSSATANITGHNVTLEVNSGSVGTYDPNGIPITLSELRGDTLTTQQQAAIAVATTPGSVLLTGTLANGQPLPANTDINSLPAGATVTGLNLPQEQPIFVAATGAFTITSGSAVYIQGTTGSSITLNSLSANGPVYVTAPGSILAAIAGATSTNIQTTGNIDLIAGSGSIGALGAPITFETSGVLTNASAGTDVYLNVIGGNAEIERVFANDTGTPGGTASITTATGYSILSDLTGINIEASNIVLNSGADIGASGTPLDILATTGTLTGSAAGSAYIDATTVTGSPTPNNLTVGNFLVGGQTYTGNNLFLEADGTLTIAPGSLFQLSDITIKALGNLSLIAGTLVMDQGSGLDANFGTIAITTSGDATIGDMSVSVLPTQVSILSTGGSIFSNADGVDISGASDLSLSAAVGIGSATTPLHIVSIQNLTASVTGTTGSITIEDDSALDVLSIKAPTAISLTATSLSLPSVTSGSLSLTATSGDLSFTSLTATAGALDVTGASISGGTLTTNTGAVMLTSTGTSDTSIDVSTVSAATTFGATAQAGGIDLVGTVTSNGTQTIEATGDITFATLTTYGIAANENLGIVADPGNIDVTSDKGSIRGTTVAAAGSADLSAAGNDDGSGANSVTATNGSVTLAAGSLSTPSAVETDWTNVNAGTFLTATSGGTLTLGTATSGTTGSGGVQTLHASGTVDLTTLSATAGTIGVTSDASTVTIGSATSDGTQTIAGYAGVGFTTLTTNASNGGDIGVTSADGAIAGGSLTADGSATLTSLGDNTGNTVTATNGSVTLAAGSLSTPPSVSATALIDWTNVNAGTTLAATSGGALTLGTVTSGTTKSDGNETIDADGAIGLTNVTATAGTLGVHSYASTVTIGSATSDGTQTIEGYDAVSYTTLATTARDGGNINVSSDTSSITGNNAPSDMLTADGSFDLEANGAKGSITATSLTATTGTGTAKSSGAIVLTSVSTPAGTLGLTSTGAAVTIGSATSDGTQTIEGYGAVSYTTLKTTAGDGGNINVSSDTSSIQGGSVSADGAASLTSATSNAGNTVTATNGSVTLAAGSLSMAVPPTISAAASIDWTNVNAGTTLAATSGGALTLGTVTSGTTKSGGTQTIDADGAIDLTNVTATAGTLGVQSYVSTVTIGSATSDGTQTIEGNGEVSFTQLTTTATDGGSIDVTSQMANIAGGSVSANGSADLTSATSNDGNTVTATTGSVTLAAGSLVTTSPTISATALIDWTNVNAGTTLAATSGGALTLGTVTSGTSKSNGDQTIEADGAIGLTTVTATAGTLGVQSYASTVTIGSATSDGTQTITGNGEVSFTQLTTTATDGGSIDVTSQTANIAGGSVMADGAASLTSAASNAGNTVTATNGSLTLAAGSLSTPPSVSATALIDWTNVNAGTTLAATSGGTLTLGSVTSGTTKSNGDATLDADGAIGLTNVKAAAGTLGVQSYVSTVTIGSATSDGTQTITGNGEVSFTQLTTTGGDGGSIDVTSQTADIAGGSVMADGAASLASATSNAGNTVTATNGSVTLAAGTLVTTSPTISTAASIDWTNVNAGTTLAATSGGALTLGSVTSGTAKSNGDQTIEADGAIGLTSVTATAGTLGVHSYASTVTIGTATSDRTQTITGNGEVSFTQLTTTATDGGSIDVTSQTANIAGGSVMADGAASLTSATTNDGGTVTATNGSVTLAAGTLVTTLPTISTASIDWTTAQAGTTLAATSGGALTLGTVTSGTSKSGGAQTIDADGAIGLTSVTATAGALGVQSYASTVTIGSATSDGTQTITADQGLTYTMLKTNGMKGDAGNIDLTSTTASITGNASSDKLTANGSFVLKGATTVDATQLTADNGSGQVTTGGAVDVQTIQVATTLGVTSTGEAVTIGSARSGGTQTLTAQDGVTVTTLLANGGAIDIMGASISGGSLTTKVGAIMLTSTGPDASSAMPSIDVATISSATTLGATARAGGIELGSATSGGTQTIEGYDAVSYTTLATTAGDGGNINVTSDTGSITGNNAPSDMLRAAGSFDLEANGANGSITATSLTATTGTGTAKSSGAITLGTVSTLAGTLGVTSTGNAVTIGSATSGGTQTLTAQDGVTVTTLLANAGAIDIMGGSISGGSLTTKVGAIMLTSTGPDASSALPSIDVATISSATTLGATAQAGGIELGSATSGGTQTISALANIVFSELTAKGLPSDPGNVTMTAAGSVTGGSIDANGVVTITSDGLFFDQIDGVAGITLTSGSYITGNDLTTSGPMMLNAGTTMSLGNLSAGSVVLSTPADITINTMTVVTGANFATSNLDVTLLSQSSSAQGALVLNITGFDGGIGNSANFGFINAPNGLVIPVLREDPVYIDTSAEKVDIEAADLTGTMRLITPSENLWFNDQTPEPVLGNNVQFYRPDDQFYFDQSGNATTTNSYVVQFDASAAITQDVEGIYYYGASFVRDFDRQGRDGDDELIPSVLDDEEQTLWSFPVDEFDAHLRHLSRSLAAGAAAGAAVNSSGEVGGNAIIEQTRFKIVFRQVGP